CHPHPRRRQRQYTARLSRLEMIGKTFSAVASFAWTFAQCNIGTIIGEETGGMSVSYSDKL
ncbi:MAG: hypothetical protein K2G71_07200, partial [Duncaniella sp.]|nr:hypothetical protein [Duncaniella sp.]